jgi:hypothetical protein
MARYRVEDIILDTSKATGRWNEETEWDGRNRISVATGKQWEHETLYKSSRNHYYLVHTSDWQGSRDTARLISEHEATRWLLQNSHPLPDDLKELETEVAE